MRLRRFFSIAREAASRFIDDDVLTLAAALTFYATLSLAPLLVLLVWVFSMLSSDGAAELARQVEILVGPAGGETVRMIIESADESPGFGNYAAIFGLLTLLFSSTGVFAQLQESLNVVWRVRPEPSRSGILVWLRKRVLSFGMVVAFGVLLLMSLALSTALSMLRYYASGLNIGAEVLWDVASTVVFIGLSTLMFAATYRVLPDAIIAWRDVWSGAFLTSVAFTIGKWVIGVYLGQAGIGNAYGAAGSLVVVLFWIYASSLVILYGAEFTQVRARALGRPIQPSEHAVRR